MKHSAFLGLLLVPVALASCVREAPRIVDVPLTPVGGQSSLAPHLFTAGDSLFVSWLEPEGDDRSALWFARWDGSSWVNPLCAHSGGGWVNSDLDIPSVLVCAGGYTAVWLERIGGRGGYGAKVVGRRTDANVRDPAWLHADTSDCEHGFVSLVEQDSLVQAVWLDGRETLAGGATALRTATLWPDGQLRGETVLDPRVCDCCPTAAVFSGDGSLVVAYRDRSLEDVRDIAVMRFGDGAWSTPRVVYRDEWKLAGCPVNGPALAVSDSLLALAWFGMAGGVDPTVQLVFSRNEGESFGAPIRVDRRHAEGRVDVAFLADGRALVVWLEVSDSTSLLWARPVAASGQLDTALLVAETAPGGLSGLPSVAVLGRDVLVAWTEATALPRVRTAKLSW